MSTADEQTELTPRNTKTTTKGGDDDNNESGQASVVVPDIASQNDVASQSSVLSKDYDVNLTSWQRFRKFIRLEIIQAAWFETVILIVIIINCVFLALDNPTNTDKTLEELSVTYK